MRLVHAAQAIVVVGLGLFSSCGAKNEACATRAACGDAGPADAGGCGDGGACGLDGGSCEDGGACPLDGGGCSFDAGLGTPYVCVPDYDPSRSHVADAGLVGPTCVQGTSFCYVDWSHPQSPQPSIPSLSCHGYDSLLAECASCPSCACLQSHGLAGVNFGCVEDGGFPILWMEQI